MDDPVLVEQVLPTPKTSVIAIPADRAGLPLAAARNVGAEAALTRGAELMIFLDVDCLPGEDLVAVPRRGSGTDDPQTPAVRTGRLPAAATGPTGTTSTGWPTSRRTPDDRPRRRSTGSAEAIRGCSGRCRSR